MIPSHCDPNRKHDLNYNRHGHSHRLRHGHTRVRSFSPSACPLLIHSSPPYCNGDPNTLGGGCSSNCYCDARNQGGPNICDDGYSCGESCSQDSDCALGQACINDSATGVCGGPTCVDYSGCSSSYSPSKRGLEFMRGSQDSAFVVKKGEDVWARDGAVIGVALSRPDGSLS